MPNSIALIGLDIAKLLFQVHAADKEGRPITKRKLKRDEVAAYFRGLAPCIVGLEACPGGHYWARVIRGFGQAGLSSVMAGVAGAQCAGGWLRHPNPTLYQRSTPRSPASIHTRRE